MNVLCYFLPLLPKRHKKKRVTVSIMKGLSKEDEKGRRRAAPLPELLRQPRQHTVHTFILHHPFSSDTCPESSSSVQPEEFTADECFKPFVVCVSLFQTLDFVYRHMQNVYMRLRSGVH